MAPQPDSVLFSFGVRNDQHHFGLEIDGQEVASIDDQHGLELDWVALAAKAAQWTPGSVDDQAVGLAKLLVSAVNLRPNPRQES